MSETTVIVIIVIWAVAVVALLFGILSWLEKIWDLLWPTFSERNEEIKKRDRALRDLY